MTTEEYLKNVTPAQLKEYERIHGIVKKMAPEVEVMVSYGVLTFKYKGTYLLYFGAYKNHMSLYGSMKSVEDKLSDYKISHKGTVQFTEDNPVPEAIVKEIIANRLRLIDKD